MAKNPSLGVFTVAVLEEVGGIVGAVGIGTGVLFAAFFWSSNCFCKFANLSFNACSFEFEFVGEIVGVGAGLLFGATVFESLKAK